eukprot:UN29933
MKSEPNINVDLVSYHCLLQAQLKQKSNNEIAETIFNDLMTNNIKPTTHTFNIMINIAVKTNDIISAKKWFDKISE